jgi:hypothetical protein
MVDSQKAGPQEQLDQPVQGIRLEDVVNGHRLYRGDRLLAVTTTKHDQGMKGKLGEVHYEDMDPRHWRIHFTSPEMSVQDLIDVVDNLPQQP